MKIAETIITKNLFSYLDGKKVLEVACGDSNFSLAACKYAKKVVATDISLDRLRKRNLQAFPSNIEFKEMDVTNLALEDNSFDATVCYNALGHLQNVLKPALDEMIRVTKPNGYLLLIATWSMDIRVLSKLENIIDTYSNLIVDSVIEDASFKILVLQKSDMSKG
ncbi:class I SAM-dependent methyltransferase [Clostridium oryzae]|uniref:Putative methyltransferase YcgJ n=1 Tax=Clostridium oryzae TaxID=1450648 RepID=A0A1V4IU93_9CLOT|nr:class I SAM-dependent methyltransferase [Clostridium oryzae]OPJ63592.1 putative methyltransferase YcgJ [Clostridium oryzae]